jgi:hypothetical protein
MKYKKGDKVRIKSLDWYNKNKNNFNCVNLIKETDNGDIIGFDFIEPMAKFCGKVMTISNVRSDYYCVLEDYGKYRWTDGMFEKLVS